MNPTQKTARIVGVLFLLALVTDLLGGELITRIIHAPDYLISAYPKRMQLIVGMLLEIMAAAAVVGIPVMLFATLRKHSERIALGYVSFRIVESVTIVVYVFSLPALLTLSQRHVRAGAPEASYFQTLGASLMAESYWIYPLITIFFSLGAAVLFSIV